MKVYVGTETICTHTHAYLIMPRISVTIIVIIDAVVISIMKNKEYDICYVNTITATTVLVAITTTSRKNKISIHCAKLL